MSLMECQKDGKTGFKWGDTGATFTGADARLRAQAVGKALEAQTGSSAKNLATVEEIVSKMDTDTLLWIDQLFPVTASNTPEVKTPGTVKKMEEELRTVWSEVYVPDFPDAHGDFMRAREIEKMAHNFLAAGRVKQVDVKHDNFARPDVEVVESWIAKEGDPIFIAGSWVVGIRINNDALWEDAKSGVLNGFSMQAKVFTKAVEIEIDVPPEVTGITERASGEPKTGHRHKYTVRFSDSGELTGGQTDIVEGHFHKILRGTITSPPIVAATGAPDIDDPHHHRYTFLDKLFGVPLDSEGRELLG